MLKRAAIEGRADDNEEVIKNRFKEYDEKTQPVADFYKEKGIYYPINGVGTMEEVFSRLTNKIEETLETAYRNIVLYGMPGSGRGTQAKRIAAKYSLVYISTGAMIREEIKQNTELGKICLPYIEQGDNVPDEVAIRLIEKKIKRQSKRKRIRI